MSKGDKRRPMMVNQKQLDDNWKLVFKPEDIPKARRMTPAHATTRVEKDKTKQIPRDNKYKYIEE